MGWRYIPRTASPSSIRLQADRNLKVARALYAEKYGRKHDDPTAEEELHEIVRHHNFKDDLVAVPAKLVLAFILRPRGRKPPKPQSIQKLNDDVVSTASELWREGVAAGEPTKRAKHDAAIKASREVYGHDLSIATIKMRMRLNQNNR